MSRRPLALAILSLHLRAAGGAAALGVMVDKRPFHLHVPASYDGSRAVPLVVLLHGIGVTSTLQEAYFRLKAESEARGFIYAYPDGTRGPAGAFWNGAGCCQVSISLPVDDVGYLDSIIGYVRNHYRLDENRIFLTGHSNGSFMGTRYVCERSQVAAIANLSGGQYTDRLRCGIPAGGRTAVLHMHGTADEITPYFFSHIPVLPSALETVVNWTVRNGCFPFPLPAGTVDLVSDLAGNETGKVRFACIGAPLDFWTIAGGSHVPNMYQLGEAGRTLGANVMDWLYAHGRR